MPVSGSTEIAETSDNCALTKNQASLKEKSRLSSSLSPVRQLSFKRHTSSTRATDACRLHFLLTQRSGYYYGYCDQNHDNKAGRLFQARRYASVSRDGRKRCPRNS